MKIAVVTDIHANREALTAVLDHAERQGAGRYVFLGDYVGYGADPGWVVDRIRAMVAAGAVAVLGNHDLAAVRGPTASMRPEPREAIAWTRRQLDDDQLAFLAARPYVSLDGERLYVHANAHAPAEWGYIVGRPEAARSLTATTSRYIFCGHVHEPRLYHRAPSGRTGEFEPQGDLPIPLPPHRQWLVLPGSCGQPRDGRPTACYAMLDDAPDGVALAFHRVDYDRETAAAKIRAAGLPAAFADRLIDGQ